MKPTKSHTFARPGRVDQLAPPRAGISLAHPCRRALRDIAIKLPAITCSGKLYELLLSFQQELVERSSTSY
eukprot:6450661-Pyramimonas_sp.AAC.1